MEFKNLFLFKTSDRRTDLGYVIKEQNSLSQWYEACFIQLCVGILHSDWLTTVVNATTELLLELQSRDNYNLNYMEEVLEKQVTLGSLVLPHLPLFQGFTALSVNPCQNPETVLNEDILDFLPWYCKYQ